MSNLVMGIILGLYIGLSTVASLSGIAANNMLWTGVVAGIVAGDPGKGFEVGAQCLMMSLGFATFGGATIPDYTVGAAFGTVVYINSGDIGAGLVVATALALLMSQMDILGRATTTTFQHLAEGALAKNNEKQFEMWTLMGVLPWVLSRTIPVCLGMCLIDQVTVLTDFANSVAWISKGLGVVGASLPAVGFALLLSYIDIKKFWPFLIIGYTLYAFVGLNTIALALLGLALGSIFMGNFVGGAE